MTHQNTILRTFLLALICSLFIAPLKSGVAEETDADDSSNEKNIIGWAEKIKVYPGDITMQAKMIPGDEGTALHATEIKPFNKGEELWVSFTLKDRSGKKFPLEREVLRTVRVKQNNGKASLKYLVQLGLCIGTVYEEAEVRLANRSRRLHQVIIGRNVLASHSLVDPSKSYTLEPSCPVPEQPAEEAANNDPEQEPNPEPTPKQPIEKAPKAKAKKDSSSAKQAKTEPLQQDSKAD